MILYHYQRKEVICELQSYWKARRLSKRENDSGITDNQAADKFDGFMGMLWRLIIALESSENVGNHGPRRIFSPIDPLS
ncbi:hypothetical protein YDYSY3_55280 [Paenibacillus chitinolyticus]|nr:hypothetical protein YDYSY3_55280 [Paenibacillus chitinolyticus]